MILGSVLTRWVPGHWLMLLVAGWRLICSSSPTDSETHLRSNSATWQHPPVAALLSIATIIGLLSGLLASGGGLFLIPVYVLFFGARLREAAATSLLCVAFLAIPGTVTHALLGHIDWWLSLELALSVVPATYLGARLSVSLAHIGLRRPFGVFLSIFAVYFFIRELLKAL